MTVMEKQSIAKNLGDERLLWLVTASDDKAKWKQLDILAKKKTH